MRGPKPTSEAGRSSSKRPCGPISYLVHADRLTLQAREAALLREHAAALNAEMADILEYQVLP